MIKNLLKLFSYNEKIILFFLILIFILFSIFDIFGLYLLSIGISGIFDQNNIYYFYNNLNKINNNFLTNWSLNSFYLFILIFFIFKNIFFYTFYYWQANFIANVSSGISSKLFEKFLNIDYIKFIKFDIAENSKNLTNDVSRSIQLIGIINVFVKEIFLLLLIVLIMLYVNLNFFLSAITLIFFLLLIFKILYSNKLKNFGNLNQHYTAKQIKRILDTFNLFVEIKLYNLVRYFYLRFKAESYKKEISEQKLNLIINIPRLVVEVFFVILLYLFFNFFTKDNINIIISDLSLLVVLSLRTIPSIISLNRSLFDLKFCKPSLDILVKKFDHSNPVAASEKKLIANEDIFIFKKNIVFNNVSFSYSNNKRILNNINFKIKKNEIIGIEGESGSGKTTLLLLLFGFIKPSTGKILVDNLDIGKFKHEWRKKISFAPQDTILINDSLYENTAFKSELSKFEKKEIDAALKISTSEKFLKKTYNNTMIDDKGLNFSGGQKKRLGLARAVYRKSDLYIFDEPTSFLDSNTSSKILKNLKSFLLNKTAIIVSHDRKILNFCDKIYSLKKSKLFLNRKI